MSANNSSSPIARLIPIMVFFGGLIGLYYLYQYLFGATTGNSYPLLTATQSAIVDKSKAITISSNQLPSLFEGGEFTISTWIYVNNWSHRSGYVKSIINVGGTNFDTIRVYLGGNKPTVSIRIQTRDQTGASSSVSTSQAESLDKNSRNSTFEVIQTDSGLLDSSPMCDLHEIDLQRWVNLTIAVNGRTVDSYVDGKLARSCVLPSNFKVDAGGYTAKLLEYGGFGGQISTTTMYDAALNPETVYKNYMAGPLPITTIAGWFANFFEPSVTASVASK